MECINLITGKTSTDPTPDEAGIFHIRYADLEPALAIPLDVLNSDHAEENWCSKKEASQYHLGDLHLFQTDHWLLGWTAIKNIAGSNLLLLTENRYRQWFTAARQLGYPHLVRTWTCLPDINSASTEDATMTHYQQFCEGRYRVYHDLGIDHAFPAATVVGSQKDGLYQCFMANRNPGISIENPRQTSAFNYPVNQHSHAPLFSRALLHQDHGHQYLFVSGTASILAHETKHPNDVLAQLREALANINVLLQQAIHDYGFPRTSLSEFNQIKVFIKQHTDYTVVRSALELGLGIQLPIVYLGADMCRPDLLVEIEATCLLHIKP